MRYLLVLALLAVVGCQKTIHEARAPQAVNQVQLAQAFAVCDLQ
jgi:hypothetical protein